MMRPLTKEERRAFVKDMYQEEASDKTLSYVKMSLDELFELVTEKNEFSALIPLFIAEKTGDLPADKCTRLDYLAMEAVEAIQRDESKTLKRAFWQIHNNIRPGNGNPRG